MAATTALDLNLKHLRAIVQIDELGSISAACVAVGLSQPALTQAVSRLEQQFGVRLFNRLPGGLTPTDAGAMVLLRARRGTERLTKTVRAAVRRSHHAERPENHLTAAQVRALLSLAKSGSFAGAAQAISLSEPAVHRAVRQLERLCDASLTERRGRSVVLSEPGRRMARGFMLAVAELNVALQETTFQLGRVTIGTMALSRSVLVPVTLAELSQRAPWAQVDVVDGSYGELIEAMRSGAIDVVIGTLKDLPAADLRQDVLLRDWITIIGRSGHPLSGKQPSLEDLAQYPWIVGRHTSALLERWQHIFDNAGIPRPRAPIQCGSVTTIRGLLVRSDFLTLLSRAQVTAELEAGLLTPIVSAAPDTPRAIGVVTRRDWLPTVFQREFLTLLKQVAANMSPKDE